MEGDWGLMKQRNESEVNQKVLRNLLLCKLIKCIFKKALYEDTLLWWMMLILETINNQTEIPDERVTSL